MAYQALYRKYRPQTFDDVVGQLAVSQTLKTQLLSGKLSHAYLFTGSRGTGKTTSAKILAKAVNCENPQDGNPCNCCKACVAIDLALADIESGLDFQPPMHLRDANYSDAKKYGFGVGYKYSHDHPDEYQQFLPDEIKDKKYL